MNVLEKILIIIFCHLVGDYVLQIDFIAKTKGENWYHLFVHCMLYCLPFYIVFGIDCRLPLLFFTHVYVDVLKARYKKISYFEDQLYHYSLAIMYLA